MPTPTLTRWRRFPVSTPRLRTSRRRQRVVALPQFAKRCRCGGGRGSALRMLARGGCGRCSAFAALNLLGVGGRGCSTHSLNSFLLLGGSDWSSGFQRVDIHADFFLLTSRSPPLWTRRSVSLFRITFQKLLDIALIHVCVHEAQDFEGDERCDDVGDEEADAGPEVGVEEEGAVELHFG